MPVGNQRKEKEKKKSSQRKAIVATTCLFVYVIVLSDNEIKHSRPIATGNAYRYRGGNNGVHRKGHVETPLLGEVYESEANHLPSFSAFSRATRAWYSAKVSAGWMAFCLPLGSLGSIFVGAGLRIDKASEERGA